jgi:hypothetical protein
MVPKTGYLVMLELSRSVDPTRSRRTDHSADELSDPRSNQMPESPVKPGLRGRLGAAMAALRSRRLVDLGDPRRSDDVQR